MLRIEEVTEARALVEYEPQWSKLAEAGATDFFQTPEWVLSWLQCFWRDLPIAFLFAREGESLAGVAPLLRDDSGEVSCPLSLAMLVNAHAKRAGFLHAMDPERFLSAIFQHVSDTRGCVRLSLCGDSADSTSFEPVLLAAKSQKLGVVARKDGDSPIIRFEGDWDTYLRSRSTHFRREQMRKCKKLEGAWAVRWATARTAKEWERAMTDVLVIERNSWKHSAGTSFLTENGIAAFYTNLARRCAEKQWLRLHVLYLDERPVAHIYGVQYKKAFLAIKTGYDEAYRSWSPGLVLFHYVIRKALEEGATVFDLLGEDSRWKREISNDARRYQHLCVYSKMQARCEWCALRQNHLKPFLEAKAPATLTWARSARVQIHNERDSVKAP